MPLEKNDGNSINQTPYLNRFKNWVWWILLLTVLVDFASPFFPMWGAFIGVGLFAPKVGQWTSKLLGRNT